MAVFPASDAQVEKAQSELRQLVGTGISRPRNVNLATNLRGDTFFTFRGRPFRVPPVPYNLGAQLQANYMVIHEMGKLEDEEANRPEQIQRYKEIAADCVALFHLLVKPMRLGDRLFWRYLSNPFGNASDLEVGELLSFFSLCRTRSGVQLRGGSALTPSPSIWTSQMSSPTLSSTTATPPGSTGPVNR